MIRGAMKIITDERCTGYHSAGHPDRPQRVARTIEKLRGQGELALDWAAPIADVPDEVILRAHTKEHLDFAIAAFKKIGAKYGILGLGKKGIIEKYGQ